MGNSTGKQLKNLWKQVKMIKQKKDAGICRNKKEKGTREKITIQQEKINQKVPAKERRLQKYRQRVKQYRQNRTFQNNERKLNQQLGEVNTKTYQQLDAKETERFWTEIWQPKIQRRGRMKKTTRQEKLKDSKKAQKQKYTSIYSKQYEKNIKVENAWPWWNSWSLVQEIHPYLRQTSTRNEQMPTRERPPWFKRIQAKELTQTTTDS